MKIPIFNSLYSSSKFINSKNLDFNILNNLDFKPIDYKRFPVAKILNILPDESSLFENILVSSNDKLVELFLNKKIKFTDIQKILFKVINYIEFKKLKSKKLKNIKEINNLNKIVNSKINKIVYKL
jgi:1-deoxy-D-xylulose-5-phosphate reductoisomerase